MARTKISKPGQVGQPKAARLKAVTRKKAGSIADLAGILKYKGPVKTIEEMNAGIEQEFRRRHARGRY